MSTLTGNPHADKAIGRLHNGTHNEVARAHVEATLALAFEQRTTTLAILILANRGGDDVLAQAREIEARLGQEPQP